NRRSTLAGWTDSGGIRQAPATIHSWVRASRSRCDGSTPDGPRSSSKSAPAKGSPVTSVLRMSIVPVYVRGTVKFARCQRRAALGPQLRAQSQRHAWRALRARNILTGPLLAPWAAGATARPRGSFVITAPSGRALGSLGALVQLHSP